MKPSSAVVTFTRDGASISLMKRQFVVVSHTNRQTEIPALLDKLGYKHTCCQNVVPTKEEFLSLQFRKNITCVNVGLLRIGQVSCVSCKTVWRWVTSNCCFMSGLYLSTKNVLHCNTMHKWITFLYECGYSIYSSNFLTFLFGVSEMKSRTAPQRYKSPMWHITVIYSDLLVLRFRKPASGRPWESELYNPRTWRHI
jgi:hypothetical protein